MFYSWKTISMAETKPSNVSWDENVCFMVLLIFGGRNSLESSWGWCFNFWIAHHCQNIDNSAIILRKFGHMNHNFLTLINGPQVKCQFLWILLIKEKKGGGYLIFGDRNRSSTYPRKWEGTRESSGMMETVICASNVIKLKGVCFIMLKSCLPNTDF